MNLKGKIDLIKESVQAIKEAIQQKIEDYTGLPYTIQGNLSTYATEIDNNIVIPNNQTKTVTSNGTVTYDVGYTGLESVTVNVNQSIQNKTITENGNYTADSGYVGLGTVTVDVQPDLGTKTITANGTYLASEDDLDGYSSVTVNVANPQFNYIIRNGISENLDDGSGHILSLSATNIDNILLKNAYSQDTTVTFVNLGNITEISVVDALYETFFACSNLTEINLSNLTTVSKSTGLFRTFAFTKVTNVDLSNLVTANKESALIGIFYGCSRLESVNLSNLKNIGGAFVLDSAFGYTALTTLSFPSLTSTSFRASSVISYTNQFHNMLTGVTGCTVHFPSNLQSVIGSWSDVIGGFGGTNTTVLFDLPATT